MKATDDSSSASEYQKISARWRESPSHGHPLVELLARKMQEAQAQGAIGFFGSSASKKESKKRNIATVAPPNLKRKYGMGERGKIGEVFSSASKSLSNTTSKANVGTLSLQIIVMVPN